LNRELSRSAFSLSVHKKSGLFNVPIQFLFYSDDISRLYCPGKNSIVHSTIADTESYNGPYCPFKFWFSQDTPISSKHSLKRRRWRQGSIHPLKHIKTTMGVWYPDGEGEFHIPVLMYITVNDTMKAGSDRGNSP